MKIDGFPYEALICGQDKSVVNDKDGLIPLAHGEQYFLRLKNGDNRRALVKVTADGVSVGEWVIPAGFNGSTLIERPVDQQKRLTFFSQGSDEANAALLDNVDRNDLGVLQFAFIREREQLPRRFVMHMRSSRGFGFAPGGTGLTGESHQVFGTTQFNPEPDFEPVVISMRLVHDKERKISMDVAPLAGHRSRSNQVPPPVGDDDAPQP